MGEFLFITESIPSNRTAVDYSWEETNLITNLSGMSQFSKTPPRQRQPIRKSHKIPYVSALHILMKHNTLLPYPDSPATLSYYISCVDDTASVLLEYEQFR